MNNNAKNPLPSLYFNQILMRVCTGVIYMV